MRVGVAEVARFRTRRLYIAPSLPYTVLYVTLGLMGIELHVHSVDNFDFPISSIDMLLFLYNIIIILVTVLIIIII